MRKFKSPKKLFIQLIPIILAILVFACTLLFKHNPELTESIYSQGVYPLIAQLLSLLSFYIPFSLSDIFYVCLVLFLIGLILLGIFQRIKTGVVVLRITQTLCIVYALFYLLWGFNYYRLPITERIDLKKRSANTEEFIGVFNRVIECANTNYIDFANFDSTNYEPLLEESYKDISDYLNIPYSSQQRRVKKISMSNFFAKATILGYYGPFFSEVHINKHLSVWDMPIVTAHEKAHQFGITSEAEANFYGCLCCLNSNDKYISYSGWLFILDYFIYEARNLEERKQLIKGIDKRVIDDLISQRKHWVKLRNAKIDNVTTKVNDAYLKTNSIEKGIEDYNDIVQLIVDLYYSDGEVNFFMQGLKTRI